MFTEPIEERYNEVLRQRVTLEGQLALLQHNHAEELKAAKKRSNRYLLLLFLLPLFSLICSKKIRLSEHERLMNIQKDSILLLQNQLSIEKNKKHQLRYIIKKGDYLTTIGKIFFNDPNMGYQIGKDNNISDEYSQYHLTPGDTLLINVP